MSKPEKEFKQEFDTGFGNAKYAARKTTVSVMIALAVIAVLAGVFIVGYNLTIGKAAKNVEREVFKKSTAYTEQAASFIADAYGDYMNAESDEDKAAIMEFVIMRYPNLDTDSIDNDTLRRFYLDCLKN